jgi:protein-S-isoprenylcysteine O-methyltransferase
MNMHIAWAIGLIFFISEAVLGLSKRAKRGDAQTADRGSFGLIWTVIGISMFIAYNIPFNYPQGNLVKIANPLTAVGVVLFVAGITLRWYSIRHLGRYFTVNVAIASDHRIIDTGPYRHVRHPSYTGALLAFVGLALALGNWVSMLIILIPVFAVFLWRMKIEEAALLKGLGEPYRSYMNHTKRLVPGIY